MIYNFTNFNLYFISESLLDKLKGPTEEEILKNGVDAYMKVMMSEKKLEGIKKALELGANVNIPGNIYLYQAASDFKFNIEILKLLLNAGIEFDADILLRLYEGNLFDALKLVEKHYGINFEIEMKKLKPYDYLKYGIIKNDIDIVKEAINIGVTVWSIYTWLSINKACDYEIVYLLLFLCIEFDEDIYSMFKRNKIKNPEYYNDNFLKLIQSFEESLKIKNKK